MQRSGSQTALLVLSILNIIAAVLMLLGGLAIMLGGAFFGAVDSSEAAAALAGSGVTQGEAGALTALAGFIFVFAGIIELVLGILGGGLAFAAELGLYHLVTGRVVNSLTGSFISVIPIQQIALPMFIAFMATSVFVGVFGGVNAIKNYLKV